MAQLCCIPFLAPAFVLVKSAGGWSGRASSVHSSLSFTPGKVLDGDIGTFFHTSGENVKYEWIQVDFGKVIYVSSDAHNSR